MVQVSIDYDQEQYAPGDTVTATINLNVSKAPVSIHSLKISVDGSAIVKWIESNGKTAKFYESRHTYISSSEFLLSPSVLVDLMLLSVGTHTYKYNFILPLTCDSTCRLFGRGRIRYKCTVEVARKFPKRNVQTKKAFIVNRPVDLRGIFSRPAHPPLLQTETFKSRSIMLKAKILKPCYVPEQSIHLEVYIYNISKRRVTSMRIYLVEAVTFIAFFNSRPEERVSKKRLVHLEQKLDVTQASDYSHTMDITIPQITPYRTTCPYIKVAYYVKIRISTSSFFGTSLSLKIPIAIGTIPIKLQSESSVRERSTYCNAQPKELVYTCN